jgi:hypothetical protein
MMRECEIAIAVLHVVSPILINNIVSDQSNLLLCLQKILLKYISQESPLLIAFPATENDTVQTSPTTDNLQLVGSLLRSINMENLWPVYVYQLDTDIDSNISVTLPFKPHSYVIFIWPEKDEMRLRGILILLMQKLSRGMYFNPKARFIIVVAGHHSEINRVISYYSMILWRVMRIVNFVIIVANSETHQYGVNEDVYGLQESNKYDIYSYFPYEGRRCGDNFEAVLVNQCYSENAVELSNNIDLFPNKVPDDFAGCSVTVVTDDTEPYEINVNKSTDLYQSTGLTFRGLKR